MAGLPPTAVAAARESAARKGLEGWRFTLQAPDYLAVMTYLDNAATRRQMYRAYTVRATEEGRDNRAADRAHSGTAPRKGAPAGIRRFCRPGAGRPHGAQRRPRPGIPGRSQGQDRARASARRIASCWSSAARSKDRRRPNSQPWDVAYYAEKQRAALYDFDEETLRPYFPLERVVAGMFDLVHRLYGIRVTEENGRAGVGPAGALLQCPRRERRVHRRILRRLVSAREQARRRVDGRADHRRPVRRAASSRIWG